MTTALAPTPPPPWWRLLYSPGAWRTRLAATKARFEAEHLAWNFDAVAPHVAPGARVLDLGAWDCRLAQALRDRRGARVVGADVVDKNATDVELRVLVDGRVPTAPDERFDVVLLLYVLHHAADDRAVLTEARRVLAPGGTIVVGEDRADTWRARLRTKAFHLWLLIFTFMGWRGSFRSRAGWTARFAEVGLAVRDHQPLGATRWWFPENELYVLTAASTPPPA
ncbi:MAG: class I SAM-dependent methyltransferase [Myxococcales bacterium]|nr:class I SAM-dependent methyltransferase [Myxococcales bacterium]